MWESDFYMPDSRNFMVAAMLRLPAVHPLMVANGCFRQQHGTDLEPAASIAIYFRCDSNRLIQAIPFMQCECRSSA